MRLEININKKHIIVVIALLIVVSFGIAQPAPNPGHSITEVSGATPNCLSNPSHASCSPTSSSTWLSSIGGAGNVAIGAANAFSLEGFRASNFCRQDGTNCPASATNTVFKLPSTSFCGAGEAFYCGARPITVTISNGAVTPVNPYYDFAAGFYKSTDSSGINCQWVLCT